MIIIQSLILALVVVFVCGNFIKKHAGITYIVTTVLSVCTAVFICLNLMPRLPEWTYYVIPILTQGGLAGSLFVMIMYAAAVPNGSKFMRRVMPIRGELSIIACILTLGHNIGYGQSYFNRLFSGNQLAPTVLAATICSLLMILIMLPLFITSFKRVRRKMQPKSWKRLQRLGYVFYGLLYAHIMLLNLPGLHEKWYRYVNVAVYSVIYIGYAILRVNKYLEKKKKRKGCQHLVSAVGICTVIALALYAVYPKFAVTAQENAPEQEAAVYVDGTYKGSAIGYNGKLKVAVEILDGVINDVKVLSHVEDEEYFEKVEEKLLPEIIEQNSTHIDAVSGATTSSHAVLEAVETALSVSD